MKDNRLIVYFCASLLLHALFIIVFDWLSMLVFDFQLASKPLDEIEPIHIKTFSPNEKKMIKTVGVKGGKKSYSEPAQKPKVQTKPGQLSLQNIGAPKITFKEEQSEKNKNAPKMTVAHSPSLSEHHPNKVERELTKQQILKELSVSQQAAKAVKNTEFDLKFEPPEGVSEDQLNSAEKKFYSFQKRTFKKYLHSFLTSYYASLSEKPYLKSTLEKGSFDLTGRVTFDREGNIQTIRITKWSEDDDVQKLFEDTLKEMKNIPNPPQELLGDQEKFNIYYQLKIDGR